MNALRRVVRLVWSWSASLWIITAGASQEKPAPAPEPEEVSVLALGQKELSAYATLAWKNGFPRAARHAWLEVLGEYAPDDEAVRKALGFYRHGAVWQKDSTFEFPEKDQLDASVARMLEQKWTALAQKLGEGHREVGAKLAAAGKTARAEYHAQRALRFLAKDAKVPAAGGMEQFEGITGTLADIAVLRRSRLMDRAVERLTAQTFAADKPADKSPLLDKAGITHVGFRSESFTIHGDWEPDVLQEAAAWAERSLAFCKEAFAGYPAFKQPAQGSRSMIFLKQKDTWVKLVRAHADRVGRENIPFLVEHASATEINDVHTAGVETAELVFDLAARWVAQDYAGLGSDAMREGIGHTIVGMFFGRNLVFSVGQQKEEGTVSGSREQQKLLLPDMDTWRELAIELAWSRGGTAAARLPLLDAAQFPTDGRIKAWSFCDYLLRRDPMLLRHLDGTAAKASTEPAVSGMFAESAKMSLADLDTAWRRFWTEDSALKRAILGKSTPLEATSKEAPAWLETFNRLRQENGLTAAGWSAQLSIDCKQHVDYLKANKDQRGPAKEHTQEPGKPGFANSGRSFAQQALVWTRDRDPKKAAEAWLLLPGYRDAILDESIETVGVYAEAGIVAIDVTRGKVKKQTIFTVTCPKAAQGGRAASPVPPGVDIELLGPDVQRLPRAAKQKSKQVGYPLTLHGFGANLKDVACTVTSGGDVVAGQLVEAAHGTSRRTTAPGLWIFYPDEPLKKGSEVRAAWKWQGGSHDVTFAVE